MGSTPARRRSGSGTAALCVVFISGGLAKAGREPMPFLQVRVKVYNSVHFFTGDLVQAEERAAQIFHVAKINVVWNHVPLPDEAPGQAHVEAWKPGDFHLRLCTRAVVGFETF